MEQNTSEIIKKPKIIDLEKELEIRKISRILRTWSGEDLAWLLEVLSAVSPAMRGEQLCSEQKS